MYSLTTILNWVSCLIVWCGVVCGWSGSTRSCGWCPIPCAARETCWTRCSLPWAHCWTRSRCGVTTDDGCACMMHALYLVEQLTVSYLYVCMYVKFFKLLYRHGEWVFTRVFVLNLRWESCQFIFDWWSYKRSFDFLRATLRTIYRLHWFESFGYIHTYIHTYMHTYIHTYIHQSSKISSGSSLNMLVP